MRKILTSIVLAVALTVAPASRTMAACGIGSHIWEGYDGWLPWLAASVTNFYTFKAISTTFEIAGCTEENNLLKRIFAYTSHNMDHLAVEMARGDGEYIEALASLLEVRGEHRDYFGAFLQEQLPALLAHDRVTAGELLLTLDGLMAADATLARYVRS